MEKDSIESFLTNIAPGHRNALHVLRDVDGDGTPKTTVEFARTLEHPKRMESPARAHTFYDAVGFVNYLDSRRTPNTLLLVNDDEQLAVAVLDDTAPHGFESVFFSPQEHPQFALIRESLLTTQPVREFAHLINRLRKLVLAVDGDLGASGTQLALLLKQITISNQVTMENGVGNGALNGCMIATRVKAGQDACTQIDLPETLTLRTPIFRHRPAVDLEVQLTLIPKASDRVEICAEVCDLKILLAEEFDAMLEPMKALPGMAIHYGKVGYEHWNYCK